MNMSSDPPAPSRTPATALRELAFLTDNQVAIREAGGIPIAVALLASTSEEEVRLRTLPCALPAQLQSFARMRLLACPPRSARVALRCPESSARRPS